MFYGTVINFWGMGRRGSRGMVSGNLCDIFCYLFDMFYGTVINFWGMGRRRGSQGMVSANLCDNFVIFLTYFMEL